MNARLLASVLTLATLAPAPAFAASRGDDPDIVLDDDARSRPQKDEPPAKSETPAKHAKLGPQGAFYTGAAVSATPYVLLGWFPIEDLTIAAGLGYRYNGNGAATSPLTGVKGETTDKTGADGVFAMAYFVHDKAPFAMGPELVLTGSLAPAQPFHVVVVQPMWALRYSPWAAPIAIGTDIGMSVAFTGGGPRPVFALATSGLDLLFAF